ncbi:MAG: hypothetical protein MUP31_05505, partial [Xanthomonadales bacterium]|nr:hypothetical protein [Xanthomonadales bacterium]
HGKGTLLSVLIPMAEQIVFRGEFDWRETYDLVRYWEDAVEFVDTSNGGFDFRLRGVKDVNLQVYQTGKVIINTDDSIHRSTFV